MTHTSEGSLVRAPPGTSEIALVTARHLGCHRGLHTHRDTPHTHTHARARARTRTHTPHRMLPVLAVERGFSWHDGNCAQWLARSHQGKYSLDNGQYSTALMHLYQHGIPRHAHWHLPHRASGVAASCRATLPPPRAAHSGGNDEGRLKIGLPLSCAIVGSAGARQRNTRAGRPKSALDARCAAKHGYSR